MAYSYNTDSYRKILDDYDDCIAWLTSRGLNINPTRLGQYRKDFSKLLVAYEAGKVLELNAKGFFPTSVIAMYEIREILDIFEGLKDYPLNQDLEDRLKKYLSGSVSIAAEAQKTLSNHARDVGFELYIGSRMICAGIDAEFNQEGDLTVSHDSQIFYVECKRPSNQKRLKENIGKAFKQLELRYEKNPAAKGIIALSITKVVNPEQKLFVTPNIDGIKQALSGFVGNFIRQYESLWQRRLDKRTIGVLVLMQAPCVEEEKYTMVMGRQFGLNNLTMVGDSDYNLLMSVAEKFLKAL